MAAVNDMHVVVKLPLLPERAGRPRFIKGSQQGCPRAARRAEHLDLTTQMRPFLHNDHDTASS